jgi:hypothetical protein
VLLLAVTNHTTENVASIPLVWIVPLSIYLFSFVVCFEGKNGRGWYSRRGWAAPISIGLGAMACALYAGHALLSIYLAYPIFWVGLFLGCVLCHGELSRSKPDTRYLTQFYLTVACGGALGGILVAVVAPLVFDNYWETPLAFVLAALLAMYVSVLEDGHQSAQRWLGMVAIGFLGSFIILTLLGALPGDLNEYTLEWAKIIEGDAKWGCAVLLIVVAFFLQSRRLRGAVALGTLICACASGWNYYHYLSLDTELAVRNFYGALRVKVNVIGSDHLRSLLHGLITHGTEFGHPPQSEMPTSYYSHTSGVGRTLLAFQDMQTTKRVGSVGLGVGTLAAYGSPGDAFRMYELNPAVLSIAMTRFSYLACSAAQVETVLGDARLSLERELAQGEFEDPARRFDVLSVDAFSGDSIPVHLLTREAFSVYTRAIKDDGVIAYHLSNRYLDLSPVVGNIARQAGYQALLVLDAHPEGDAISPSLWVLVTKNAAFLARPAIASVGAGIPDAPKIGVWTDQLNNLFQVLK